ncbi:MAG TPA: PspA/IM30 family protein [Gemmatirosa sp.]
MGIFDRFSRLVRSNINDLISSAEDPEKMLNQLIGDMNGQLVKAKQQVAGAIADERRLKDQAEAEARLSSDWESRAMLAVNEGRDDLARQALLRQSEHAEHARTLASTWDAHRTETEKLKAQLRELADKIEEAKRKKNLLLARQRRAEAQQRIAQTMSSISEKSAFEAFARMEEKIDANERQLRAANEIDEEFTGDKLAREFKQLERSSGGADADSRLLALKQKMGVLPAPAPTAASLPAGTVARGSLASGNGAANGAAAMPNVPATAAGTAGAVRGPAAGAPHAEDELLAEFEELSRDRRAS